MLRTEKPSPLFSHAPKMRAGHTGGRRRIWYKTSDQNLRGSIKPPSSNILFIHGSSLLLVGNPLFPCRFWSMLAHPINPMDGGRHWINAPSTHRFLGSQHLGLSQTLSLIKVRAKS